MGRASGYLEDEENFEILQYLLYVFNTIFFIAGSMIFALGMYLRFDSSMQDYITAVEMQFYWDGATVLIIAASLTMVNCFVGCCATFLASKKALVYYMVVTIVTFIMLLGGSAYLLQNGMEGSNLFPYIQQEMQKLIQRYQWDVAARRQVDIVQEYIGCCGGYSADDYISIHLPVPDTCRHHITGNQYGDSCAEILSQFIEKRTGWICGLSLCLCFLQLFAIVIAVYAYIFIKRIEKTL